jgi:hypothetical protein
VEVVLTGVEEARRQLAALSAAGPARTASAVCELGRELSQEVAERLRHLATESPATYAAARAAGERFDSHVLAATLLEASHASPASVFEIVARGLIRLTADVERLARTRRLPA